MHLSGYSRCVHKNTRKQYLILILVGFAKSGIVFMHQIFIYLLFIYGTPISLQVTSAVDKMLSLINSWINQLLLIQICILGGTAAAVTTPLDVAKTRIMLAEKNMHSQVDCARLHTSAALINIYREQGIQGYVVFIYNWCLIDSNFFWWPSGYV